MSTRQNFLYLISTVFLLFNSAGSTTYNIKVGTNPPDEVDVYSDGVHQGKTLLNAQEKGTIQCGPFEKSIYEDPLLEVRKGSYHGYATLDYTREKKDDHKHLYYKEDSGFFYSGRNYFVVFDVPTPNMSDINSKDDINNRISLKSSASSDKKEKVETEGESEIFASKVTREEGIRTFYASSATHINSEDDLNKNKNSIKATISTHKAEQTENKDNSKESMAKANIKEEAIKTLNAPSDSLHLIMEAIKRIMRMKQGEFEKKEDFESRKQYEVDKLIPSKLYSTTVHDPDIKFDPDREVWIIEIGEYKKAIEPMHTMVRGIDRIEIIVELNHFYVDRYQATNAMGASVTVEEITSSESGVYIKDKKIINSLKEHIIKSSYSSEILAFDMPMDIETASKYGKEPNFKYRLVYKIDDDSDDEDIIETDALFKEATFTDPKDIMFMYEFLCVEPIAFIVYEGKEEPLLLWYFGF